MNKFLKLMLTVTLSLAMVSPAYADVNRNGGLINYDVNGAKKLLGTANQVYATNPAGTNVEMKTVSGTGGITVTGGSHSLSISGAGLFGATGSADQVFAENHAGNGGEAKTVVGAGGITVTGATGLLTVDGSLVGYSNVNTATSITAVLGTAVFVTGTATITLPTAVGNGGRRIMVVNNGVGTVTFNTTAAQKMNGTSSGALTNATRYDVFEFISDNANWFYQHTATP